MDFCTSRVKVLRGARELSIPCHNGDLTGLVDFQLLWATMGLTVHWDIS